MRACTTPHAGGKLPAMIGSTNQIHEINEECGLPNGRRGPVAGMSVINIFSIGYVTPLQLLCKKRRAFPIFSSAMILFLLCAALQDTHASEASSIIGRVVGVHDGDSITVLTKAKKEIKIRLEGIDAPELNQPFGARSKAKLKDILFETEVTVAVRGNDRFSRTIGRVFAGKIDVSLEMVKCGLAWRFEKYSKELALIEAQKQARQNRIGLWAGKKPVAPWQWRSKKSSIHASNSLHSRRFSKHASIRIKSCRQFTTFRAPSPLWHFPSRANASCGIGSQ